MSRRSDLRAQVFEIAGNQCEHPMSAGRVELWEGTPDTGTLITTEEMSAGRCLNPATELAHITPRGMGHTGYRDTLVNVMAACPVHARSTDDLGSEEWEAVPGWKLRQFGASDARPLLTKRQALVVYVNTRRRREGVDLERSDR